MSWFSRPDPPNPSAPPPPPPSSSSSQRSAVPPGYARPAYESYAPVNPQRPTTTSYEKAQQPQRSLHRGGRFSVVEAPSPSHALANRIVLNDQDWNGTPYVVIKGHFPYATMFDPAVPRGAIGAARLVRQWVGLSQSGDVVDVEPLDPNSLGSDLYLASLDLEVRSLPSLLLSLHPLRTPH